MTLLQMRLAAQRIIDFTNGVDDSAMYRLGKALVRLHEWAPPTIITEPVDRQLRALAPAPRFRRRYGVDT